MISRYDIQLMKHSQPTHESSALNLKWILI